MRLRTPLVIVLLCSVLVIPGTAHSVEMSGSTWELGLSGYHQGASLKFDDQSIGKISSSGFDVLLGYFINPVIQINGGFDFQRQKIDPENDPSETNRIVSLTGGFSFNVPIEGSGALPYAFVGTGVTFYNGEDDVFGEENASYLPILQIGLRMFPVDDASVNLTLDYTRQSNVSGFDKQNANIFTLGLGVSFFVGNDN